RRGSDPRRGPARESLQRRGPLRLPPVLLPGLPGPPRNRGRLEGRAGPLGHPDRATGRRALMPEGYFVGVDTGGTSTDCVVVATQGRITTAKAASTPPDFAQGVLDALARAGEALGGVQVEDLLRQTRFFGHGTTVGTNALLTRGGAKTGLLTTRGHEDMLFMGRIKQKVAGMNEDQLHDFLTHDKDDRPLVPRRLVQELNERVDYK